MNYKEPIIQPIIEPNPQLLLQQVSLKATIGSQYLLKDISFEVLPSDRIVIIGASGSGKTTLLRLLNRLIEPTSGKIYLDNLDYQNIPIINLRRQVMLVPQEPKLLGMTVKQALAYPLVLQQLPQTEINRRLLNWTEQLHIPEEWLDRLELQLSLGQRQLVAIARALVTHPKILLLDEPTSALDIGRASHLINVLTDLTKQTETSVLMVNHQLDLAQRFCTRVLYLQDGQLLEDVPENQINWAKMRDRLIEAEKTAAEEWE